MAGKHADDKLYRVVRKDGSHLNIKSESGWNEICIAIHR